MKPTTSVLSFHTESKLCANTQHLRANCVHMRGPMVFYLCGALRASFRKHGENELLHCHRRGVLWTDGLCLLSRGMGSTIIRSLHSHCTERLCRL